MGSWNKIWAWEITVHFKPRAEEAKVAGFPRIRQATTGSLREHASNFEAAPQDHYDSKEVQNGFNL